MPAHELRCPPTAAKRCREGPDWAEEREDGCEGGQFKLSGTADTLRHTHRVIPAVGVKEQQQGKQDVQGLWPMYSVLVRKYMRTLTMASKTGLLSEFDMWLFHVRLIQLEALLRAGWRAQAEAKIEKLMCQEEEFQRAMDELYMDRVKEMSAQPNQDNLPSPESPESPEIPQNPDSPKTPTDQPTKPPELAELSELRALAEESGWG